MKVGGTGLTKAKNVRHGKRRRSKCKKVREVRDGCSHGIKHHPYTYTMGGETPPSFTFIDLMSLFCLFQAAIEVLWNFKSHCTAHPCKLRVRVRVNGFPSKNILMMLGD